MAEACVAGAGVVDRESESTRAQVEERVAEEVVVVDGGVFGQLEDGSFRLVGCEQLEASVVEESGRAEIDRQEAVRGDPLQAFECRGQGGPFQFELQADRASVGEPSVWALVGLESEAGEGLETDRQPARKLHDRLVDGFDYTRVDRLADAGHALTPHVFCGLAILEMLAELAQDIRCNGFRQCRLAGRGALDRLHDLFDPFALDQIGDRSGTEHREHGGAVLVCRQGHDPCPGGACANLSDEAGPAAGHLVVDDRDIRLLVLGDL